MLKTIDLFAGAGGLSLGFLQTGGYKILAAAEINKNARNTYQKNIVRDRKDFIFIDNVTTCNFALLNEKLGGIDVVIGGPPCQGFSNANRQKNNLISMNNGLVKEFFRAIKEIKPKAFVMENVSMLRSDTHRFYESIKDNEIIVDLIAKGFSIPKREDVICISKGPLDGFDYNNVKGIDLEEYSIPEKLYQLLNVLNKDRANEIRLRNFIRNNSKAIIMAINSCVEQKKSVTHIAVNNIVNRLLLIKEIIIKGNIEGAYPYIEYIVSFQKAVKTLQEITQNGIIGEFSVGNDSSLLFTTHSYSVIDYINAILGGEYYQIGNTVNAKWFGVPQDRKRYIIIGIRKDLCKGKELMPPEEPNNCIAPTVGEAILDLQHYPVGYQSEYAPIEYLEDDIISNYAVKMRKGSTSVKNHITTKTTETAMQRFKAIQQGKNFHSLTPDMKTTYSKPERTQNTIYLRLNQDEPAGTVVNVRKSMWIHPILDRAISVREAARLQSFPDDFEFCGTKDSQYQQVGNAVPPLLAKHIAIHVLNIVK